MADGDDQPDPPQPTEAGRRRTARQLTDHRAMMLRNRAGARPEMVTIRDVSTGDIGIVSAKPLSVGSVFALYLAGATAQPGMSVVCTVTRCEREKAQYIVGATFVRKKQVQKILAADPAAEDDEHRRHLAEVEARLKNAVEM